MLTEKVKSEPAAASRLVQGWVRAGGLSDDLAATASGNRKAAILMVMLGEEAASQIYRHLPQADVDKLRREIAGLTHGRRRRPF